MSRSEPPAARILVTDDEPAARMIIERTLGGRFECHFAASVAQARGKLKSTEFELALLDIHMPGESGFVLAEEIAATSPTTGVVLVTGEDDPEKARRGFDLGVSGYLVKPFRGGQLLITVINALRQRELEIANAKHRRTLEHRLQEVIDGAPMPIYVKDRAFRYVIANRKAHRIAQLEPGGLIGLTDEAIMTPEGAAHARESDRLVLETGETFEEEQTLTIGEAERSYLTVKFPLLDDDQEIYGVCGISAEITAQKQAERLRGELATVQEQAIEELRTSRLETVERLAKAVELRDAATGGHVGRIGDISALLAEKLGFDPDRVELMRSAAPMHDVGKIGISDEILLKPGSLTNDERRAMKRHATIGHDLLADSQSELLRLAATIARTHHEHFDGSGYPSGLVGEEIPVEGRIVAVADVFDALLSTRSYRPALPLSEALEIMRSGRGSHFDPAIVDVLLDALDDFLAIRAAPEVAALASEAR